jgi:hypothetical protein
VPGTDWLDGSSHAPGCVIPTIETYRSNIKTKLNLKDAAELVRFATSWSQRP